MEQGVARKAQQEPEGEMEKTETPGAAEAPAYLNFWAAGRWRMTRDAVIIAVILALSASVGALALGLIIGHVLQ